MHDFIGDIHGHADQLRGLLTQLGYTHDRGAYRHPERTVIFLGDYIDRGPDNPGAFRIVREMVEAGSGIALMGNHEYNAILFNTPRAGGGYLRAHTIKNFKQHAATLLQFQNRQAEYDDYVRWMKTLPLYLETDAFRAVHASWHQPSIDVLSAEFADGLLTEEALQRTQDPDARLTDALEKVLKGLELPLPTDHSFLDKDGTERFHIRYRWWENPVGNNYRALGVHPDASLEHLLYSGPDSTYYHEQHKPVFFGHYWLKGLPNIFRGNICCLDFSVAKGGYLAAYRFDGEQILSPEKLVWV